MQPFDYSKDVYAHNAPAAIAAAAAAKVAGGDMGRGVHWILMASTVTYNVFSIPAGPFGPLQTTRELLGTGRDHVALLLPCVAAVPSRYTCKT